MRKKIFVAIISLIAIFAINININPNLSILESFSGNSVMYVCLFIILYSFSKNIITNFNNKKVVCTISILLTLFYLTGKLINEYEDVFFIFSNFEQFIKILIKFIGTYWVFSIILQYIYNLKFECTITDNFKKYINSIEKRIFSDNKLSFIVVTILIFIAWIPYLLQYYPGFVTNDSINQIYQGIGLNPLTTHHPVIHTGIISICMKLGNYIKDYNLGIAIYSIFQMIIMSMIFSYATYYMAKRKVPLFFRILTLIYFMFYQIHALYSISMWKDILFGGVFLIFIITVIDMISDEEKFFSTKRNYIKLILVMLLVMLFRNNGLYVIILFTPIIIIIFKKKWKKLIVPLGICYLVYFIITGPIYSIMKIQSGSIREALSVPMQQIARVTKYHKDELPIDEKNEISKYIVATTDEIAELYNPLISDPIKEKFDGNQFSTNKLEFIKLWTNLLVKYPQDYINAFLCNSYGYWFPESTYWISAKFTIEDSYIGIGENHIINSDIIERYSSIIDQRQIPILSMFYSIGFNFWIIIISIGKIIIEKKNKMIGAFIPILLLWLTTLASPVFCEYRYVYSIFTCQPILIALAFLYKKENYI